MQKKYHTYDERLYKSGRKDLKKMVKAADAKESIKNVLLDDKKQRKIRRGLVAGGIVIVLAVMIVGIKNLRNNNSPGNLAKKAYEYINDGTYSMEVDGKTDITCTFEKFSLPLSTTFTTNGTIDSDGTNKNIKLTLNGDMSSVLGNDKYEDTSVQIYTNGKKVYYGIGDEFTWKKVSDKNIMKTEADSPQQVLISLKQVPESKFLKAFSDGKIKEKGDKTILTGKLDFTKLRNSKIKDQLYVLYGMNDVKKLTGTISVTFDAGTPVSGEIKIDAKNTASADDMYNKMKIKDDGTQSGETTDVYDQMNVDDYVTDDNSLGNMVTEINGSVSFTFNKLKDDIEIPDMSKEKETKDTSDVPLEWCGLNNTINYYYLKGDK